MRLNFVHNLSVIEYSVAEILTIYHVFECDFRGGAKLTELSQGCVDPTSPNLARTEDDHCTIAFFRAACNAHEV